MFLLYLRLQLKPYKVKRQENYKRASFSTNQHVMQGNAFKNNMMKFVK